MKKLWVLLMLCASIQAYAKKPCLYDEIQVAIRDAEYVKDVEILRNKKDAMNGDYSCQSPFQLAILRGNYNILYQLLQFGLNANKLVPMVGFNEDGEYPDKIPPILFAARYAVNGDTIQVLIDAGVDPKVKDANGNDFFWYLEQNPVLRRTYMSEGGFKYLVPGGNVVDEEGAIVKSAEPPLRVVLPDTIEEKNTPVGTVSAAETPLPEEPEIPAVPIDEETPLPLELPIDPSDAMGE